MFLKYFVALVYLETIFQSCNCRELSWRIEKKTKFIERDQNVYKQAIEINSETNVPKFTKTYVPNTDKSSYGHIRYDGNTNTIYLLSIVTEDIKKENRSTLHVISGSNDVINEINLTYDNKRLFFDKIFVSDGTAIAYDKKNNVAAVTPNKGENWIMFPFSTEVAQFIFHGSDSSFIAAISIYKFLYVTDNKGESWTWVNYDVTSVKWAHTSKYLYYIREENKDEKKVMNLFRENMDSLSTPEEMATDVVRMEKSEGIIYAIVKNATKTTLIISNDDSRFTEAIFPHYLKPKDFVLKATVDDELFVAVKNESGDVHLYSALLFDLKFKRIVDDISPSSSEKIICVDLETFRDLPGVILAQKKNKINGKTIYYSAISFDHGNKWTHLRTDSIIDGKMCEWPDCYLRLQLECENNNEREPIAKVYNSPNLLMAHGTIFGKDFQNHDQLFISTDGGLFWHRALPSLHEFAMVNHGSAILSFPRLSSEAYYSYNFGLTWSSYDLSQHKLIPMMMFRNNDEDSLISRSIGIDLDDLRWVLIKADFSDVLKIKCTIDDYDLFTPGTGKKDECFQGRKSGLYKRKHDVLCQNIQNILKPPPATICPCKLSDFGCSFGNYMNEGDCVADPDFIPEKPQECKLGEFEISPSRRGKLHGDVCKDEGLNDKEFAEICGFKDTEDSITIITGSLVKYLSLKNPNKIQFTKFPLTVFSHHKIQSFAIDHKGKCIYFVKLTGIYNACWRTKEEASLGYEEKYVNDPGIFGVSFDMFGRNLYYYTEEKIFLINVDTNYRKNIIFSKYKIYYLNILPHNIYMAYSYIQVNGKDIKYQVVLAQLNGIILHTIEIKSKTTSITYDDNRHLIVIFTELKIYEVELDNFTVEEGHLPHPDILLAELREEMNYFVSKNSIFVGPKSFFHSNIIQGDIYFFKDIEKNPCSVAACSHFCFPLPKNKYLCGCPESMVLNGTDICECDDKYPNCLDCQKNEFHCKNGKCIDVAARCNGIDDCGDKSDENDCKYICEKDELACGDEKTCVSILKRCDGVKDCPDGLDEEGCPKNPCESSEYKCFNNKCIPWSKYCNGVNDCGDFSDEDSCEVKNCLPYQVKCKNGECILPIQICNGIFDCSDWSDEQNCEGKPSNSTDTNCVIRCDNKCIPSSKICDHFTDCSGKEDELDCGHRFECPKKIMKKCSEEIACYMPEKTCDGFPDCIDGSDEFECKHLPNYCDLLYNFKCATDDQCIHMNAYCDGKQDCQDGSDESEECFNQLRVREIRMISRTGNSIEFDWKFNRNILKYNVSIMVQNWYNIKDIRVFKTEYNKLIIKDLKNCNYYTIMVTVSEKKNGRALHFVSKNDNMGIPLNISYEKKSSELSWNSPPRDCIPNTFFISCFVGEEMRIKNFTSLNSLKIPFNSQYKCKISSCPSTTFNISCSEFSQEISLFVKPASNKFLNVGLPIIIVSILLVCLVIGFIFFMKTRRFLIFADRLGFKKLAQRFKNHYSRQDETVTLLDGENDFED